MKRSPGSEGWTGLGPEGGKEELGVGVRVKPTENTGPICSINKISCSEAEMRPQRQPCFHFFVF